MIIMIIVGLDNNEMYGIPSIFLNARRKTHPPTNEDKEEALIQYHPIIPNSPKFVMTYSLPVSLKKINNINSIIMMINMFQNFKYYLFIYLFTYLFIYLLFYLFIYYFIYLFIILFIY